MTNLGWEQKSESGVGNADLPRELAVLTRVLLGAPPCAGVRTRTSDLSTSGRAVDGEYFGTDVGHRGEVGGIAALGVPDLPAVEPVAPPVAVSSVPEPVAPAPAFTEPLVSEPVVTPVAAPVVAEPWAEPLPEVAPLVPDPLSDRLPGPAPAEPVVPEPAFAEPEFSEPVFSEPVFAEPVFAEPVFAEPFVVEPVFSEPVLAAPVELEPFAPPAPAPATVEPWAQLLPEVPPLVPDPLVPDPLSDPLPAAESAPVAAVPLPPQPQPTTAGEPVPWVDTMATWWPVDQPSAPTAGAWEQPLTGTGALSPEVAGVEPDAVAPRHAATVLAELSFLDD